MRLPARGVWVLAVLVPALSACRDTPEEHIRKAHVLFTNKKLDEAQAEYQRAAELDANNEIALEGLGNVYFERGDLKAALSWYEKAAAADDKAINARHRLAITRSELGDVPGAIAALEEALKIDPENTFALNALGGLYEKTGDKKRAEEMQVSTLRVDPQHRSARFALASIFVDTARFDDAERELTKLHRSGAEALAEYGFARLEAKRGRPAEAAKRLTRVLELGVNDPSKVLSDDAFTDVWSDPAMASVREKLEQAAKK